MAWYADVRKSSNTGGGEGELHAVWVSRIVTMSSRGSLVHPVPRTVPAELPRNPRRAIAPGLHRDAESPTPIAQVRCAGEPLLRRQLIGGHRLHRYPGQDPLGAKTPAAEQHLPECQEVVGRRN